MIYTATAAIRNGDILAVDDQRKVCWPADPAKDVPGAISLQDAAPGQTVEVTKMLTLSYKPGATEAEMYLR
jgi:hypothetical protein